jgi:hypothetical protein
VTADVGWCPAAGVRSLAVAAVHDVLERAPGAEVQVHPIALPLDLIDRVLAVVLATGLEGEQLSIPGSAWSAARKSLLPTRRSFGSVGSGWTDEASNVSRPDPSGAVQSDAE